MLHVADTVCPWSASCRLTVSGNQQALPIRCRGTAGYGMRHPAHRCAGVGHSVRMSYA